MKETDLNLSRRKFIKQTGLLSLTYQPVVRSLTAFTQATPNGSLVFFLIRPADMLCLQFEFTNCQHVGDVVIIDKNATVSIRLPQQHIEDKFVYASELPLTKPTQSAPADYSHIVYNLKKGRLHFDVSKWLDWNDETFNGVFNNMVGVRSDQKVNPEEVTRFEFPYGIWLTPLMEFANGVFSWDHSLNIADTIYNNRVELWTSRLKAGPFNQPGSDPNFRLMSSLPKKTSFDDFTLPDKAQRDQLFQQTNNPQTTDLNTDQRVRTNKSFFQISPFGITTKLLYKPGYDPSIMGKIVEWRQESDFGRDNYVEVVTTGWIYPYLIRCEFVTITRRVTVVSSTVKDFPQTALITKVKFRRSQKTVTYSEVLNTAANAHKDPAGRGLHYSDITLVTIESPEFNPNNNILKIDPVSGAESLGIGTPNYNPIWPILDFDAQKYYEFQFQGTDQSGAVIGFSSSFIFIPDQLADSKLNMDVINKNFLLKSFTGLFATPPNGGDVAVNQFNTRRQGKTKGQNINYVKNDGATGNLEKQRQDVASLQTEYFVFTSWPVKSTVGQIIDDYTPVQALNSLIPFFPRLESASVIYPPLKSFMSDVAQAAGYKLVSYPVAYLLNGINAIGSTGGLSNAGKVFLKLYDSSLSVFDYDDYTAVLNFSTAVAPAVGDIIKGNVTGAVGKVLSIAGNAVTLSNVVGTFNNLDTGITLSTGAVAAVASYLPPLTANDIKQAGALIKPTMKAAAFSLINGVVSTAVDDLTEDLATAINSQKSAFQDAVQNFIGNAADNIPKFSVKDFLPSMRLLGNDIKLTDLILNTPLPIPVDEYLDAASDLADKYIPIIKSITDTEYVTALFNWVVNSDNLHTIAGILFWRTENSQIAISCSKKIPLRAGISAESTASCTLTDFNLNFFGFVEIEFSKFSYKNSSNDGTKIDVSVSDVTFGGSLSFVGLLSSLLQTIDNALNILIEDARIGISYALPIPTISLPCFSLAHLKIDTKINIPLDLGSMSLSFGFNDLMDPFTIAVIFFGGGGSVHSSFDTTGIIDFGASFEFGGYEGIDIFVAEGNVYLFAGFYFDSNGRDCLILRAYVRAGGELSILDIVSASITFYLDLQYQVNGNQTLLTGSCTVEYSIHIAFFSISVPLTLRKDFAGSAANQNSPQKDDCGPTMLKLADNSLIAVPAGNSLQPLDTTNFSSEKIDFTEHMDSGNWREYINAFSA